MKKLLSVIAGVIVSVSLLAAPAHAGEKVFRDKADDAREEIDIRSVKVVHKKKRIAVAIKVADLPKQDLSRQGWRVWIDTSKTKGAPNYLAAVEGYHLIFGSTRGWSLRPSEHGDPYGDVNCRLNYSYQRGKDRVVLSFKPKCIGKPKKIRVAVTAARYGEDGEERDFLGKRRQFSAWVKR